MDVRAVALILFSAVCHAGWNYLSQHFKRPLVGMWLMVALALVLAWLITFFTMAILGSLAFFLESSSSLWFMWQGLFFALSGYLFPLAFLERHAPRLFHALHFLPFYYQSGFPLELMLGQHGRAAALQHLAVEACWVVGLGLLLAVVWRAGIKRWNAFGA